MSFFQSLLNLFSGDSGKKMKKNLSCPVCRDKELTVEEKLNVKIYLCNYCRGCFLTQDCLSNFLNFHDGKSWPELFDLEADSGHTFQRSPESRTCPGCDDKMDNVEFQYISGIWVDYCPNGHGVWLDSGELKLIKEHKAKIDAPMSPEEKSKMFISMLDGGTEAKGNINKVTKQVKGEFASRHYGHSPIDRDLIREKVEENIEKRKGSK